MMVVIRGRNCCNLIRELHDARLDAPVGRRLRFDSANQVDARTRDDAWKKLWFDAVVKVPASNFWAKRPTVQMQLTAWMSNPLPPFWLGLAGPSGQCRHLLQRKGGSPGPTSRGFSHCDSMSLKALL